MNCDNNSREEMPLDPAVEKVRRRMMRLMSVSITIMLVSIIAVIGAIFYKINNRNTGKSEGNQEELFQQRNNESKEERFSNGSNGGGNIVLTAGSQITRVDLSGEKILLTIKTDKGELELWVYDLETGHMVSKIRIIK